MCPQIYYLNDLCLWPKILILDKRKRRICHLNKWQGKNGFSQIHIYYVYILQLPATISSSRNRSKFLTLHDTYLHGITDESKLYIFSLWKTKIQRGLWFNQVHPASNCSTRIWAQSFLKPASFPPHQIMPPLRIHIHNRELWRPLLERQIRVNSWWPLSVFVFYSIVIRSHYKCLLGKWHV